MKIRAMLIYITLVICVVFLICAVIGQEYIMLPSLCSTIVILLLALKLPQNQKGNDRPKKLAGTKVQALFSASTSLVATFLMMIQLLQSSIDVIWLDMLIFLMIAISTLTNWLGIISDIKTLDSTLEKKKK